MLLPIQFIPATAAHAEELALTIRPEDLAEVFASGFTDAQDALLKSIERSNFSFAAMVDGKVAALFGLARFPHVETAGVIWFVTGSLFLKNVRHFMRVGHAVMAQMLAHTGLLMNHIDARYEKAVRWARWLGFEVKEPVAFGPLGLPFHPIAIRRE